MIIDQKLNQLNEERQQLAHLRQNLDSRQQDLEAKEAKLQSIMPLIPSTRELQAAGVTFDIILLFVTACHEKSGTSKYGYEDCSV